MSAAVEVREDRWLVALARALIVLAVGSWLVLAVLVVRDPPNADTPFARYETLWLTLGLLAMVIVGSLLAMRLPRHPVPWLLAVPSLVTLIFAGPVQFAFDPPASRGEATVLHLLDALFFAALVGFLLLFPMLFPDGRLLGPRWRWAAYGAFVIVAATVVWALWDTDDTGMLSYAGFGTRPGGDVFWGVFGPATQIAGVAVFVLGAASLVVKYLRGSPVLRKQMRVPFVVLVLWLGIGLMGAVVLGDTVIGDLWGNAVTILTTAVFAGAIAVSVTRYGLYEVDRLVNRTIVYAIVVVVLGVLFATGALWLPSLIPGADSSVAVAVSTLAVAALFTPVRRQVQRFVDRRFYRSRYDAQRVADEFAAGLRDELDADVVAAKWADVVNTTLQPAAISVWVGEGT